MPTYEWFCKCKADEILETVSRISEKTAPNCKYCNLIMTQTISVTPAYEFKNSEVTKWNHKYGKTLPETYRFEKNSASVERIPRRNT